MELFKFTGVSIQVMRTSRDAYLQSHDNHMSCKDEQCCFDVGALLQSTAALFVAESDFYPCIKK